VKRSRRNHHTSRDAIQRALENYATYGPHNPTTNVMTNEEMDEMQAEELVTLLHGLYKYDHRVIYAGPHPMQEVIRMLQIYHETADSLKPAPDPVYYQPRDTEEEKVYFAHYDANQSHLNTVTRSEQYDPGMVSVVNLYNRYFSGGMNSIVFQEMRERRGLAYMAHARFSTPSRPEAHYMNTSVIATQNDKVIESFHAFNELFDDLPLSATAFELAKERIISDIRTERINRGGSIVSNYLTAKDFGRDYDVRSKIFEETPFLTLEDLETFNHNFIRNRPKTYVVLGNEQAVDFDALGREFGEVIRLTTEDLFPY